MNNRPHSPKQRPVFGLIFLLPLLTAAYCNLGTWVIGGKSGGVNSSEAYERGVADIVVERLALAPYALPTLTATPLPTLTPTPTFTGTLSAAGDGGPDTEPNGGNNGAPGDGTPQPAQAVTGTAAPGTPTVMIPSATAPASPTLPLPTPTLPGVTPTPAASATPAPSSTTKPNPPADSATATPVTPPADTATATATATSTSTPTATGTPGLDLSVKLSDPTGEVFPNGTGGDTPITYTIRVVNNTGSPAAAVTVYDALPVTFTLEAASIYGPGSAVSGSVIQWGPFNVPARSQVELGFRGAWPYNAPTGVRGRTETNLAKITAPWLTAPLTRTASIFVMYPPNLLVLSASLTPTVVAKDDLITFYADAFNSGSAGVTLKNTSRLLLTDGLGTTLLTTNLAAAQFIPADSTAYTLTFNPAVINLPTGAYPADIYLDWQDENNVDDTSVFTNISGVAVYTPPTIQVASTPAPGTILSANTSLYPRFYLWNSGDVAGQVQLAVDSVEFSGDSAWPNFSQAGSYNFPCGYGTLWSGLNTTVDGRPVARYVITPVVCGDPYLWQPEPPPNPPIDMNYAYFDLMLTTPPVYGVYTITVTTSLNDGTIVNQHYFPFTIGP